MSTNHASIIIDDALLRAWPLPSPHAYGATESDTSRPGRALVVAGSREMPGAAVLAARAVLRTGAATVTLATGVSMASAIAIAVPEVRVLALPETEAGCIAPSAADLLGALVPDQDAVLIGPGMQDEQAACALVLALLPQLANVRLVLDAGAMHVVRRQLQAVDAEEQGQQRYVANFSSPAVLTLHPGEMAHLAALDKQAVLDHPEESVLQAARRWNASVVLKGARTHIADTGGRLWRCDGDYLSLTAPGSGDVLAGVIAGLAARGASLEQACAWGVALHARAAARLAQRHGPLGSLASELIDELPARMHAASEPGRPRD